MRGSVAAAAVIWGGNANYDRSVAPAKSADRFVGAGGKRGAATERASVRDGGDRRRARLRQVLEPRTGHHVVARVVEVHVVHEVAGEVPSLGLELGVQVGDERALLAGQVLDEDVHLVDVDVAAGVERGVDGRERAEDGEGPGGLRLLHDGPERVDGEAVGGRRVLAGLVVPVVRPVEDQVVGGLVEVQAAGDAGGPLGAERAVAGVADDLRPPEVRGQEVLEAEPDSRCRRSSLRRWSGCPRRPGTRWGCWPRSGAFTGERTSPVDPGTCTGMGEAGT